MTLRTLAISLSWPSLLFSPFHDSFLILCVNKAMQFRDRSNFLDQWMGGVRIVTISCRLTTRSGSCLGQLVESCIISALYLQGDGRLLVDFLLRHLYPLNRVFWSSCVPQDWRMTSEDAGANRPDVFIKDRQAKVSYLMNVCTVGQKFQSQRSES